MEKCTMVQRLWRAKLLIILSSHSAQLLQLLLPNTFTDNFSVNFLSFSSRETTPVFFLYLSFSVFVFFYAT